MLKTLRLVLVATINGACGPRHQSDLRAHGTNELPGLGGRHAKSFISNDALRQGGMETDLQFHRTRTSVYLNQMRW
jgi:hypothetical protein